MGFKRNNNDESIESILERNREKQIDSTVVQTPVQHKTIEQRKKKERETTKSFNFTMRPSVRQKLNDLVDYDPDSDALSAAGYLSDLIEKRHFELGLSDK